MGAACGRGGGTIRVEGDIEESAAKGNEALPELDAWINHSATYRYWVDKMSTVGGHPNDPSDMRLLLTDIRRRAKGQAWADFLGEGLLGAASSGNLEGAKQLVSCMANLRWKDRDGRTPLHLAADAGHAGVVSLLLLADGQSCARQVWQQSKGGHILVLGSISLVQKIKANPRDNSGLCPLHLAAGQGHAGVVELLLQNGGEPGDSIGGRQTPLHSAAKCSFGTAADIIRLLVKAGADVMARDSVGRTPLHYASSHGTEEAISALVRAEAEINAVGSIGGSTPLHEACARLRPKNVQRLLDLDADERRLDADGKIAGDRIGQLALGDSVSPYAESLIRDALAGAEKGRTWRRRRLWMLLRSRQPALAQVEGRSLAPKTGPTNAALVVVDPQPLVAVVVGLEYDVFRTIVLYL